MEFIAFGSDIPADLTVTKAMVDYVGDAAQQGGAAHIGGAINALLSGVAELERRLIAAESRLAQ